MSDPPVKTKRAGNLAATSPNCFELGDYSATEPEEQPPKKSATTGRKQRLIDLTAARSNRQAQARAGLLIKILRVVQRPVTSGFWWLEQRFAALDLEIERLRM